MARRTELDTSLDIDTVLERLNQASEPEAESQSTPQQEETLAPGGFRVTKDADGNPVWEIVQETPQERMARMDRRYRQSLSLLDENDVLFDNHAIQIDPTAPDRVAILERKKGPFDPSVIALKQLRANFKEFDYGANGLVPAGSEEAKAYHAAIQAVRDGKVRLPTVSEYQKQKKEYEERMKQMETTNNGVPPVNPSIPNTPPQPTPPPAPVPEQNVAPPPVTINPDSVVRAQGFDIPKEEPPVTQAPPTPEATPKVAQVAPINMFEMQDKLRAQQQPVPQQPVQQPEAPKAEETAQFSVPAEKAETFYDSLPEEEKQKVTRAKIIQINEVNKISVPATDKVIATPDAYRKIVKRKVAGEFVEVVLPNSGYIATVKPATSMAMATLIPDTMDEIGKVIPDYAKRYQFAYDYLVTTSVGPMSYNEFLNETGHGDLDALLWAIYKASTANTEISINCSNPKCRKAHKHKFSPDNAVNLALLSNATKVQINTIISARDVEGDAKIIHKEAPAVNVKTYELNPYCFVSIKVPDAQMMIERVPIADVIVERYSRTIFGSMCYIKEMRVSYDEGANWYTITDPGLICEEIYNMGDDELEILLTVIQEMTEKQFDSYSFRIPGPITCPFCGTVDPEIREDILIDHMLFFRVNQLALRE